ncbi:enolase C-terminal domain-like protein [Actinoalloteichus hymeniacidonis]|uniref:Enolase superfamily enzyme related to L-alanine-DL-glutamate epimerase n=1 Tax=Actinoalloteichus hymeniacidonis TaxID=340345 RepID=A0AAC9MZ41_9PSEU|nr:enolase C-terminal domain-like protein [Actinoalloteichus hymeniacidonis]AOS63960.1 enolase superfamily enzyme related to L-alanine-DL-glutamate epimerase [Actinoalloteichus hymeniacidonis]MBB5907983.1 L-alanine-DL-glutamate epimerase-like enolase superfamily enzyme [Actinoalloteichus hymeniacidonis]
MPTRPPDVARIGARAYRVPTPRPEADGTLLWPDTTIVVVQVEADPVRGLGWTYADAAVVPLIEGVLAEAIAGRPLLDVPACWAAMQHATRNLGRPGLVSCALSAVDIALWDASARWLELPVSRLLGRAHRAVDVYGSGGFTTLTSEESTRQLAHWVHELDIPRVKIKIAESWGNRVERDLERIAHAREIIGEDAALYVDANGGYSIGQAGRLLESLRDADVTWFEEPVSSDDLAGLASLRAPGGPDIAAGEYGYDLPYFARLLPAVDCLQVDVTRCGGYTEWRRVAALAAAANRDVSAHCAPNLSAHAAVTTPNFRHIEWFADHDRIESLFFDGCLDPTGGTVTPSMSVPGHGLSLRSDVAADYAV